MVATDVAAGDCDVLTLQLEDVANFAARCPEQYDAVVECAAFVNWRQIGVGKRPILALVFFKATRNASQSPGPAFGNVTDRLAYPARRGAVHPDMTTEEVNAALHALFKRAEAGRSTLIEAAQELDAETAKALLVRQVVAVYAARLDADDLQRWYSG